jgi:hypothetical protein
VKLEKWGYLLWDKEVMDSSNYVMNQHSSSPGAVVVSRIGKDQDSGRVILPGGICNCAFRRKYCLQCKHEYMVDSSFNENRCSFRFLVDGDAVAKSRLSDSTNVDDEDEDEDDEDESILMNEGENDVDESTLMNVGEDDVGESTTMNEGEDEQTRMNTSNEDGQALTVDGAPPSAAQLPSIAVGGAQQEGRQVGVPPARLREPSKSITYGKLLEKCKSLCFAVADTANSLIVTGVILTLTRLAQNGEITEGTYQEVVRNASEVFKSNRKKRGSASKDTSTAPFVGKMSGPGRPLQQRKRGPTERPAPSIKQKPSCAFCRSTMKSAGHCRISLCPRVRDIGTFLEGNKKEFAEKLLDGSSPCKELSTEDRLKLTANVFSSLPRDAKFLCVHRQFVVSQALSNDFLYLAKNRAAEVTMYGDGGVVLEGYGLVAASVTAVSTWIHRNMNQNTISAMGN